MTEKELLHKLYIEDGKSLNELAKMFNSTRITVTKRLRKYGIKIRSRGQKAVEFKINDNK